MVLQNSMVNYKNFGINISPRVLLYLVCLLIHSIRKKKKNQDVKKFCEVNFNISFPLSSITEVKGENAHELFKWAADNHGKSAIPKWNFHKILINKEGKIEDTYSSFTKPLSNKIIKKIESIL